MAIITPASSHWFVLVFLMNVAPPESPSAPIASYVVLPPPGLCVKFAEKATVPLAVPVPVTLFVPQRLPLTRLQR